MIPITSFAGKTVAVFGLGGSGLATCHALKAGGAEVIAGDDSADNLAKAAQAGFTTADLRSASWQNFAALVLTPGAPLTHPAPHWSVLMARQAGVEVIGDIELFCRERRRHAPNAPFVAITGTNGKSTTTALIAHLTRVAGYDSQMGGNIGTANALSSFGDIFWIAGGKPKAGGITSLTGFFPRIRKAYLIGEAAQEFSGTLGSEVPHEISQTLDVAVEHAARDAEASGLSEA